MRPRGIAIVKMSIVDDIDAATAAMVADAVAAYPHHEIELALAAPGGDWIAASSIFSSLCEHERRVTAIIERAASGGALIAMAAEVRKLAPHGVFFLHRPNGPHAKAVLDKIADTKAAMMSSRCRIPQARIRQWMEATTTLSAEQALHYGLATEVPGMKSPTTPTVFL